MDKLLEDLIYTLRLLDRINGHRFPIDVSEPYLHIFGELTDGILKVESTNTMKLSMPPKEVFMIDTNGLAINDAIKALEERHAKLIQLIYGESTLHAQSMREVARDVCKTNHVEALKLILEKINEQALRGHLSLQLTFQGNQLVYINDTIAGQPIVMVKELLGELQKLGYSTLLNRATSNVSNTRYWVRWE